jgi:hypothetical protein
MKDTMINGGRDARIPGDHYWASVGTCFNYFRVYFGFVHENGDIQQAPHTPIIRNMLIQYSILFQLINKKTWPSIRDCVWLRWLSKRG